MTQPVVAVRRHASVREAAELLADRGFAAVPVVDDDGELIGMVSEADLLRHRVPRDPAQRMHQDAKLATGLPATVGEIMTTPVATVALDSDLGHVADLMLRYGIRSVPVIDGTRMVGIVSRRDLLRTLVRSDHAISADVRERLDAYGGSPGRWKVSVSGGIVTVEGEFGSAGEPHVVERLARTVSGVLGVRFVAVQPSIGEPDR